MEHNGAPDDDDVNRPPDSQDLHSQIDTLLEYCPPAKELFPSVRATVELGRRNAKFLIHPIVCTGGGCENAKEEDDHDDREIPSCSPRVTISSDEPNTTNEIGGQEEQEEDEASLVPSPPSASQGFRIPYTVWHIIVEYLSDPPFSYQHKVTTFCDPRGWGKGSYLVLSANDEALLAFSRCCRLFRHLAEREAGMFPALLNRAAFLWTMHSNKLPHDEDEVRASRVEELKTLLICPQLWSSSSLFRHLQRLRFGQQQAPRAQPEDHALHMFLTHYGSCKETSVASDPLFVISFVLVQTLVLQKMMPPYQEKVEALARRSVFLEKLRVLLHCGFLSVEPQYAEPVVFYVVQSSVGYGNTDGEKSAILVLEELKKQGFSLNAGSLSSGLTPLHAAIRMWKVDIVEWLLDNGADPENYRIWRSAGDCYTQGANVVDTVVALRKIHHTISLHLAAKLDGIVDLFVKRGYIQAT